MFPTQQSRRWSATTCTVSGWAGIVASSGQICLLNSCFCFMLTVPWGRLYYWRSLLFFFPVILGFSSGSRKFDQYMIYDLHVFPLQLTEGSIASQIFYFYPFHQLASLELWLALYPCIHCYGPQAHYHLSQGLSVENMWHCLPAISSHNACKTHAPNSLCAPTRVQLDTLQDGSSECCSKESFQSMLSTDSHDVVNRRKWQMKCC